MTTIRDLFMGTSQSKPPRKAVLDGRSRYHFLPMRYRVKATQGAVYAHLGVDPSPRSWETSKPKVHCSETVPTAER